MKSDPQVHIELLYKGPYVQIEGKGTRRIAWECALDAYNHKKVTDKNCCNDALKCFDGLILTQLEQKYGVLTTGSFWIRRRFWVFYRMAENGLKPLSQF